MQVVLSAILLVKVCVCGEDAQNISPLVRAVKVSQCVNLRFTCALFKVKTREK